MKYLFIALFGLSVFAEEFPTWAGFNMGFPQEYCSQRTHADGQPIYVCYVNYWNMKNEICPNLEETTKSAMARFNTYQEREKKPLEKLLEELKRK